MIFFQHQRITTNGTQRLSQVMGNGIRKCLQLFVDSFQFFGALLYTFVEPFMQKPVFFFQLSPNGYVVRSMGKTIQAPASL
jgi:hypothetical protein